MFEKLVTAAGNVAARSDVLITFGIAPNRPATGYGYIEAGTRAAVQDGTPFYHVERFHEKPDEEKAAVYVQQEHFYWNSGIFIWRPSVFLASWLRLLPEGIAPLERIAGALGTARCAETTADAYPATPAISVDYGILEKADNVLVAPAAFDWNDVGSWDALFEIMSPDGEGNIGAGETAALDSHGNLLFNPGGVTAVAGIDDLCVVVDGTTVLVCRRGQSQRVRELIELIEGKGREDLL